MVNDKLADLLAKKALGMLSLPEQVELKRLMEESFQNQAIADYVEEFNGQELGFANASEKNVTESFNRVIKKINAQQSQVFTKKRNYHVISWLSVAAVFLIVAGAAIFFRPAEKQAEKQNQNIVSTKKGSKTSVVLPDGTLVYINSDSRISYSPDFGAHKTREVTLVGEAYFDVAKDKTRPFIVHTQNFDIKVLGTVFNVRSYEDEKTSETTLLRGSVEVLLKKTNSTIMLKPSEKITIRNTLPQNETPGKVKTQIPEVVLDKVKPIVGDDSTFNETFWLKNKITFDQAPLEEIASTIEKWYDVKIVIKDPALNNRKISGTFEGKSLHHVMEALELAGRFKYSISEENIITIVK